MKKSIRTLAVFASAALVLGAFGAPTAQAKKKKKKPPAPVCAPFTPWEKAAEAPVTVVTDAATAEAPVEVALDTEAGLGFSSADSEDGEFGTLVTHAWANVQVDSAAPSTGLFVRLEFQDGLEYDLFLRLADGTSAAYAAGSNHVQEDPLGLGLDGTGHGGHSEVGAEAIDGFATEDCAGYSVDVASAITPGGGVTLKYWLGEPAA